MSGLRELILGTVMLVILGAFSGEDALAGQQTPSNQLVGTWRFVSTSVQRRDGTTVDVFGPNPKGILIFTEGGYFALTNTRSGRANFASDNRLSGTEEENRATVQGVVAYFGTYTVDESSSTYSIHIDGSSFPNYEGTVQARPFKIVGDTLTFINPAPTTDGTVVSATLRRVK